MQFKLQTLWVKRVQWNLGHEKSFLTYLQKSQLLFPLKLKSHMIEWGKKLETKIEEWKLQKT